MRDLEGQAFGVVVKMSLGQHNGVLRFKHQLHSQTQLPQSLGDKGRQLR